MNRHRIIHSVILVNPVPSRMLDNSVSLVNQEVSLATLELVHARLVPLVTAILLIPVFVVHVTPDLVLVLERFVLPVYQAMSVQREDLVHHALLGTVILTTCLLLMCVVLVMPVLAVPMVENVSVVKRDRYPRVVDRVFLVVQDMSPILLKASVLSVHKASSRQMVSHVSFAQ